MTDSDQLWRQAILPHTCKIQAVINSLDKTGLRIVLVTNENSELQGTISDGDVRRGLLRGLGLDSPAEAITHLEPLVVPPEMGREWVQQLMIANKIQQIPILDSQRQILGLHSWDEIAEPRKHENTMVIMAGGIGTRLRPHTENCPKPLVPVAGRPMLEHIIERAKSQGFRNFVISLNYLGHMIEEYFGDGANWEVNIQYIHEDSPLGTAGALSLFSPSSAAPFIVTNGDVLTDVHYGELLDFHISHKADATMAVRLYEWTIPFGEVVTDGVRIASVHEKPVKQTHVNAGIYVLEPSLLSRLETNSRIDMPTFFEQLMAEKLHTVAYPMHEPWLDVGRPEDLEKAHGEKKIHGS